MSESEKTHRRGLGGGLAAVLLLAGGAISWQFRPLNATERRLVGT